jgi:uncharacterized protein
MKNDNKTKNMTLTNPVNCARYDTGLIGNEVEITHEGYIKGRCIVTRCGVFLYKNADGTIRKELRDPTEVNDYDSLKTIRMIPIVDGHPSEKLINADNSKRLSVGYTGEEIEEEYPFIIANLVITDKATVEKIKSKEKNQLSLGYTVDLIPESGYYNGEPYDYRQTNIRYNHLALVDEARAGAEARIALDGEDAIRIFKEGADMAGRKQRKIKIDTSEYMVDEGVGEHIKKMMEEHAQCMDRMKKLEEELDRAHAERDSMRDKDHHNPNEMHEGREEDTEYEKKENEMDEMKMPHHMLTESEREKGGRDSHMRMKEGDEIGPNGKEEIDPYDSYGMQSHVRDYEKPSHMREHVVNDPKNRHYPHDLPHIAKVDHADIKRQVRTRVRLEKLSERYLDKTTVQRLDSMSDLDIKKKFILNFQKNAILEGKSETYINARFDSVLENLPREQVIATPSRFDSSPEKDNADSNTARLSMIHRQKNAYKNKVRA